MARYGGLIILAFLGFLTMRPAPAQALTFKSGQTLVIDFTVNPPGPITPDVLFFIARGTQVMQPYQSMTARLYDGNLLLGEHSDPMFDTWFGNSVGVLDWAHSWVDTGSLFTFGNPTTINFQSIVDGTIDGRIEVTIASGSIEIDPAQVQIERWQALHDSGGAVADSGLITLVRVEGGAAVPEPLTTASSALAMVTLAIYGTRRTRRCVVR